MKQSFKPKWINIKLHYHQAKNIYLWEQKLQDNFDMFSLVCGDELVSAKELLKCCWKLNTEMLLFVDSCFAIKALTFVFVGAESFLQSTLCPFLYLWNSKLNTSFLCGVCCWIAAFRLRCLCLTIKNKMHVFVFVLLPSFCLCFCACSLCLIFLKHEWPLTLHVFITVYQGEDQSQWVG